MPVVKVNLFRNGSLHGHVPGAPWHVFDLRPGVLVVFRCEFGVECVEFACLNPHRGTRATVAVVLGQVENAPVLRYSEI